MYLARYPVHTTETLDQLDEALNAFNNNHQIFIDLGIHLHFNFPKGHFMHHYHELIKLYGMADNFNTKYAEQLHIDLAKDAYHSTNMKDEYPQMTAWLDQCEQVILYDKFIQKHQAAQAASTPNNASPETQIIPCILPLIYPHAIKIAGWAAVHGVSLTNVKALYGALHFEAALSHFVIHL